MTYGFNVKYEVKLEEGNTKEALKTKISVSNNFTFIRQRGVKEVMNVL